MASQMFEEASGQFKEDETYLCYEYARDSFVGVLEDKFSMREVDVKNYIKYSNPSLYERLHCLPFATSDIPQSFQPQRQFKKAFEVEQARYIQPDAGSKPFLAGDLACEMVARTSGSQGAHIEPFYTFDNMKIDLKNDICAKLIDGHILVLKKHPPHCHPLNCESPSCRSYGLVNPSVFYLTLRPNYFSDNDTVFSDRSTLTHYCLYCLEDIFDDQHSLSENENSHDVSATLDALDGVGREVILQTAQRLYHTNKPTTNTDQNLVNKSGTAHRALSEAKNCTGSRAQNHVEIEATLAEITDFEKRRKASEERIDTSVSGLSITRPYFMERPKDRYKKQGLTWHDKYRLQLGEEKRQSVSPQISPTSTTSCASEDRQCYCREPGTSIDNMIQCSNNWCPIGWIHLQCAGLDESFVQQEDFFCSYCEDDSGSFRPSRETKSLVALNDSGSTMTLDYLTDGSEFVSGEENEAHESERAESDEKGEEENGEDEEDIAIMIRSAPWGTPINPRSTSSASDTNDPLWRCLNHSEVTSTSLLPSPQSDRFDGAESDNSANSTSTNDASHYTQATQPGSNPQSELSHSINFVDLAPYIVAIDLSQSESRVFERWKNSILACSNPVSTSITIHGENHLDDDEGAIEAFHETTGIDTAKPHEAHNLSQLLLRADIEMEDSDPEFL